MTDRICSIESCGRKHYAKGWCNLHWKRWRKHGDPSTVSEVARQPCSVVDCDRLAVARGWCDMHWRRWRKHGDPAVGERRRNRCTITGCVGLVVARGWCSKHHARWKRHGDPMVTSIIKGDDASRFELYIRLGSVPAYAPHLDECWLWIAGLDRNGYGNFRGLDEQFAHRWSYRYHVGQIPAGLTLDHLCRVRRCVNPWHLEPVPPAVNTQRAAEVRYGDHRPSAAPPGAA